MKFRHQLSRCTAWSIGLVASALVLSSCSTSNITVPESPEWDGALLITSKAGDDTVWTINGIEQKDRSGTLTYTPRVGEYEIVAAEYGEETQYGKLAALDEKSKSSIKVFGIEETSNPPVVDDVIGEDWNDPPTGNVTSGDVSLDFRALMVPYTYDQITEMSSDPEAEVGTGDLYVGYELVGTVNNIEIYIGSRRWNIYGKDGGQIVGTEDNPFVIEKKLENVPDISQDYNPVPLDLTLGTDDGNIYWADHGLAYILPDPSTIERTGGGRKQLSGGETELKVSETATKDSSYHTPVPVEYAEFAAHKPDWLDLKCPWEGTFEVSQGYGFEAKGWTHQTIGNMNSANDFFGIDLDMPVGTPILAPADGRIVQSNRRGDSYGNYIVIDHGEGLQTIYAHLDSIEFGIDKGDPPKFVKQGDLIGMSGDTGTSYPHLHFALHKDARASHSGANVGGLATCMEPLDGFYGIRKGHKLTSTNKMNE